jgi:pilus assembly protein CpaC
MTLMKSILRQPATGALAVALSLAAGMILTSRAADAAPATTQKPASELTLSVGRGQLITLSQAMSDVFVANEMVADVQVRSPTQLYVFAKGAGETSIYATTKSGTVVFSANVKVGNNVSTIDQMIRVAMPEANIQTTTMNGMVLLTGTVKSPGDSDEAERLVQAYVGDTTKVVSRLRTATPLQVNLQVKIAEVNRTLVKEIGANLLTRDTSNGFNFGVSQGRNFGSIGNPDLSGLPKLDASSVFGLPAGTLSLPFDVKTGQFVTGGTAFDFKNLAQGSGKTSLSLATHLLGLDMASAIDLAEQEGLVSTLAQPNLTALSGETASFLAGGEFPIPISQQQGQVTVEYKQYGVSLAFTPTVLDNGRISMRVRPEVSELTSEGTVRLNGFDIPGVATRRAETTVELGSGQSFMIGGLLRNSNNNVIDRTPGAGNVPVLGALFRSTRFRKSETELVIIVTPYLVKPVSANDIALPTDNYKAPSDIERVLLGKTHSSTDAPRPKPTMESAAGNAQPQFGANTAVPVPGPLASAPMQEPKRKDNGNGDQLAMASPFAPSADDKAAARAAEKAARNQAKADRKAREAAGDPNAIPGFSGL